MAEIRKRLLRIISYIYPVRYIELPTRYSGVVEINYVNGKKLLDTRNANQSYGSLERILDFGLRQLDVRDGDSLLIGGLGGGSVIKLLETDYRYCGEIVAVEIDSAMIEIASDHFGVRERPGLKIVCDNLVDYIAGSAAVFDIIVVDTFIDDMVPDYIYDYGFWLNIRKTLSDRGRALFNAGINQGSESLVEELCGRLSGIFDVDMFSKVEGTNTLLRLSVR